ncbi:conserved hypothetical protein [Solidesulfovibrio fructosivorans JJ]]|uniref:Uncharacterized protein n=1 Tax=Solidesulfovibrio fructosivorans JJ] TaxID=596151 RepID=E1K2L7_SOLFR|nr:hypothetical protein [Solidesulfovibrio fructosivorans]EFL49149.1 conserved hypothetical protein [Solidesulfovibrio fructosivorans JJ]]
MRSSDTVTLIPLNGTRINDMILDYMSVKGAARRAELAHFLSSSRNIQSEIMAVTLRGMMMNASV